MLKEWVEASRWHEERPKAAESLHQFMYMESKDGYADEVLTPMEIGNRLLKKVAKGRIKAPYSELIFFWRQHRKNREEMVQLLDKLFFRLSFTNFIGTQAWYLVEFSKHFVVTITHTEVHTYFNPLIRNLKSYERRWEEINPKLSKRLGELKHLIQPDSELWKIRRFEYFRKSIEHLDLPQIVVLTMAEYALEVVFIVE